MRRTGLLLAFLLGLVLAGHPGDARADAAVGINLFYDDLAPYGDWFQMEDYGWVWTPRRVASDWRPYTRGRWVFGEEDGWMWASDEEFGWATGHYGRWFFDDRYGWVWVPGNEWAPAWVSWRSGGGYVGWAPLPPQFRWNEGVGFRGADVDFDAWIAPRQYVFVPERHFVDSGVYRQVVPPARNVTIVNVTRNVTNYGVRQNRPVNRSLSLEQVEGRVGHAVPRVRVVEDLTAPPRRAEVKGGAVKVFRPAVRGDAAARPRSVQASKDLPKVKPHPAEPPVDPKVARRPDRPATVAPRPAQAQPPAAYANVKPAPTDARRRQDDSRAAEQRREAQAAQHQSAELKLQQDRQRQEQQAREHKEQLQQTQERQEQALRTRQAQQEQQLQQKQKQQQEREASARQGQRQAQLERQQEEQRLKLQQQHERDHQALQGKQARQQQQLQESQRKQQAQAEETRRKQQQREEAKKPKARPQSTVPPS